MRETGQEDPIPQPADGVPTAEYALARLREAIAADATRSLWEALQLALTYVDQESPAGALQAALWVRAIATMRSAKEISTDLARTLCFNIVGTALGQRTPADANSDEQPDWQAYASFLETLGASDFAKLFRGNAKRIAASLMRATTEMEYAHDDALNRRFKRPPGSHTHSVFPLHIVFLEALSRHPDGSPEARVAAAGMFALRVLDHYMKVGDEIVEQDAIEVVNVRRRVAEVADDHPMRAPLMQYVNRLQRAPQDGVDEALRDLVAVGDAWLSVGEERFAAETYATVARYADPLELDAATAMRKFRAVERRVRARGEELEGHPYL